MTIHYQDDLVTVHHGDSLDVLPTIPDSSVHAVVTDPPYGLEFMGKEWDSFNGAAWRNTAGITATGYTDGGNRVARPSYGGGDTANPTCQTCRGRKRGANRCDCEAPDWRVNGKPVEPRGNAVQMRAFGDWCGLWAAECLRILRPGGHLLAFGGTRTWHRLACAVEDAGFELRDSIAWLYGSGFPKSLDVSKAIDKAAGAEREVVGDKLDRPGYHLHGHDSGTGALGHGLSSTTPETRLAAATITAPATDAARQWAGWGTALRPSFEPIVVARKPLAGTVAANVQAHGTGALNIDACRTGTGADKGIWPVTNRRHADVAYTLQPTETDTTVGRWPANVVLDQPTAAALDHSTATLDDGRVSRFFPVFRYEAKAPQVERPRVDEFSHPTTKPLDLMRWLVRLVTPPGGLVVDPFAGSGTTAEACVIEGFRCVTVEREPTYLPLIVARLTKPIQPDMFGGLD